MAGLLTSIPITSSPTSSLTFSSIDVADEDKMSKSSGNGTNLSNLSPSTKSTGAGYLTSGGAK